MYVIVSPPFRGSEQTAKRRLFGIKSLSAFYLMDFSFLCSVVSNICSMVNHISGSSSNPFFSFFIRFIVIISLNAKPLSLKLKYVSYLKIM